MRVIVTERGDTLVGSLRVIVTEETPWWAA